MDTSLRGTVAESRAYTAIPARCDGPRHGQKLFHIQKAAIENLLLVVLITSNESRAR
jgi:hypothetical protein